MAPSTSNNAASALQALTTLLTGKLAVSLAGSLPNLKKAQKHVSVLADSVHILLKMLLAGVNPGLIIRRKGTGNPTVMFLVSKHAHQLCMTGVIGVVITLIWLGHLQANALAKTLVRMSVQVGKESAVRS